MHAKERRSNTKSYLIDLFQFLLVEAALEYKFGHSQINSSENDLPLQNFKLYKHSSSLLCMGELEECLWI